MRPSLSIWIGTQSIPSGSATLVMAKNVASSEEAVTRAAQWPETLGKSIGVSEAKGDRVLWRCMDTIIELCKSISFVLQPVPAQLAMAVLRLNAQGASL
jgi:hypothetical protein